MVFRRGQDKSAENKTADKADKNDNEISNLRLEARMDALDRRLDNIDSMVTAVAERVMSRPLVMNIVCPHCGKGIEISLIGQEKPTK
ncbi:MAG: hypothetical protein PHE50_07630 [Dehalococcoidales bacterium]|nr:hypothetical protein [Dehalococcoidales bacterium]